MLTVVTAGLSCQTRHQAAPHPEALPRRGGVSMKLESPAFGENDAIPRKYTCEGENLSPPLTWSGAPEGTRSLALIVDDPDAPDPAAPRTTWVHWVLYDIPPGSGGLPEAVRGLPRPTRAGLNDWKKHDYGGPCPPIGRHRYFHKLYALDSEVGDLGPGAGKAEVEKAMAGHVLGHAELVGTYQKKS